MAKVQIQITIESKHVSEAKFVSHLIWEIVASRTHSKVLRAARLIPIVELSEDGAAVVLPTLEDE